MTTKSPARELTEKISRMARAHAHDYLIEREAQAAIDSAVAQERAHILGLMSKYPGVEAVQRIARKIEGRKP